MTDTTPSTTLVRQIAVLHDAPLFVAAINAATLTASDDARGVITAIRFDVDVPNGTVKLTSTDSYTMGEVTLHHLDIVDVDPFTIARADLARYVKVADKRTAIHTLRITNGLATFDEDHPSTTLAMPCNGVDDWPRTDSLWPTLPIEAPTTPTGFDPDRISTLCKAVSILRGRKGMEPMVWRGGASVTKPHVMTARGSGWSYRGLIMPVRLSEGYNA